MITVWPDLRALCQLRNQVAWVFSFTVGKLPREQGNHNHLASAVDFSIAYYVNWHCCHEY